MVAALADWPPLRQHGVMGLAGHVVTKLAFPLRVLTGLIVYINLGCDIRPYSPRQTYGLSNRRYALNVPDPISLAHSSNWSNEDRGVTALTVSALPPTGTVIKRGDGFESIPELFQRFYNILNFTSFSDEYASRIVFCASLWLDTGLHDSVHM